MYRKPPFLLRLMLPLMVASTFLAVSGPSIKSVSAASSQGFSYTGMTQTFTVPSGVTEVQVYVRGGGGGSNQYGYGSPGKGAYVSAVLAVTPGETLTIAVGAVGSMASSAGVFGGGAGGGTTAWYSSTGGGASDIRSGGSALVNRKVVAGGGGGNSAFANGGNGGTPIGGDGLRASPDGTNAQGGRGGTQNAGGAGGLAAGSPCYTANGSPGSLGDGGRGGINPGGSGGGGGYYGGGGGGSGCNSGGGGGGSSYADPVSTTSVSYALASSVTAGCVEITWPVGAAASSCLGVVDNTAPALSSSVPADNATGISTSSSIVLNFSENVTAVSAKNIVIKKSSDDSTVESISVTDGSKVSVLGSQVTVNPSSTLDDSTGYYVTVDSGAFKDAANNVYAGISSSTALNFTTAAPITAPTTTAPTTTAPTTTAPPVTTVTNPGSTDTTVPASILSGRSTTTTVVAQVAPTVAPTTTTTIAPTTTTSTTIAVEDVPAPPAPDVAIGEAVALVNGEPVTLSISRENNVLTVSGAGISMTVSAVLDDGTIAPLDTDGNVRLDGTRLLQLKLSGVALGSDTEVWIYSTPVRLGVFSPDAEGSISARLVVPDEIEGGEHRFVVKSRAQSGDDETLALGIVVGASSEGVQFEWLIGVPLTLAIAAALIIPATRRRRKAPAEA